MSETTTAAKRRREPRLPRWLKVLLLVGVPVFALVMGWVGIPTASLNGE